MEEHNNLSNRCPELQNILDSSFGFRFKWGTLLVILFILLILALSFFVSIREEPISGIKPMFTNANTNLDASCA